MTFLADALVALGTLAAFLAVYFIGYREGRIDSIRYADDTGQCVGDE